MTTVPDAFVSYLADFERLAPGTVEVWVHHTRRLLAFVADGDAVLRGHLSTEEFSSWLRDAERRGLASGTREKMWYAVRALYRWLEFEGYEGPTPLRDVRPPRVQSARRRDYTSDEAEAVMEAAAGASAAGGWREAYDFALLATLRFTGCRSAEVAGARREDLDLGRRYLSVSGKGHKRRIVPLPRQYVAMMRTYLDEVRPRLPPSSALFPARGGSQEVRARASISTTWVFTVAQRCGEASGVAGPHHPHRWRHTYATHLLRAGVDVSVVQALLGHSSITTTSIYLHLVRDDLRSGVEMAF